MYLNLFLYTVQNQRLSMCKNNTKKCVKIKENNTVFLTFYFCKTKVSINFEFKRIDIGDNRTNTVMNNVIDAIVKITIVTNIKKVP